MEKALKMGKTSATGTFQLFVGTVVANVIMAVGTIIFGNLLSTEQYGLYSVALIPSLMINLFRDWGVNSAMTKYVTQFRATKKEGDIRDIIAAGLIFEIVTGIALSLLSLFLASFIASSIFHRPESAPLIAIVSITIFSGSLLTAAQSVFFGFERMNFHSLTITCQAIFKLVLTSVLILLGFGALGAVLGYTFSFLFSGLIALALLYFVLFRGLKGAKIKLSNVSKTLRQLLHYGVPLSIASLLGGFMARFYGFVMVFYCSDIMIGNYQIAANFAVFITFFTFPISTVLFPAFAKVDSKTEPDLLKTVFSSSIKYTTMLLVPATMAMMVLSSSIVGTLFGDKWVYAPLFLPLLVVGNLFVGLGDLTMWSLFNGQGETKKVMMLSLLTILLSLPLSFLLVPSLGIVGVIIGPLFAEIPSMFFGLHYIWKRYKLAADYGSSARIFLASAIAAGITYLSLSFLHTAEWLRLVTGGIVFLAAYIIVAPSIKAIVQDDISNLRSLLSGMGFISTLINLPLGLVEKFAGIVSQRKN